MSQPFSFESGDRFSGIFRAQVISNDDPKKKDGYRRFQVRTEHFKDVKKEHLPWAPLMPHVFSGSFNPKKKKFLRVDDGKPVVKEKQTVPVMPSDANFGKDEAPQTDIEQTGEFNPPTIDSWVMVMFEAQNPNQPIIVGEAPDCVHGFPKDANRDYPETQARRNKSGLIEYFNTKPAKLDWWWKHPSKTRQHVDKGGSWFYKVQKHLKQWILKDWLLKVDDGEMILYVKNNATILVDGDLMAKVHGDPTVLTDDGDINLKAVTVRIIGADAVSINPLTDPVTDAQATAAQTRITNEIKEEV